MTGPGVHVKICGLTRPMDAEVAAGAGADYLGCVLVEGSPRCVTPGRALEVGEAGGLPLVVVVAGRSVEWIEEAALHSRAAVIQLHGDESPDMVAALAERGPWTVWKGVRTRGVDDARAAIATWAGVAQGLLLDGWAPGALGGTGVSFDWEGVAGARGELPPSCLFIAAGGLNPENVGRVVSLLTPDVVDVSSGVEESPGRKSPSLVRDFVRRARSFQSEDPHR